jgi:hypothetical protein
MNLKELEKEAAYQGGGAMTVNGDDMALLLKAFRAAQKWAKWAKDYQRRAASAVPSIEPFDKDETPLAQKVIDTVHDVENG